MAGLDTDLLAARGGPQGSKATGTSEPVKEDGIWDPAQEQEKGNIRKSSYLQRPFRQSNDTDSITGHIRADEYKDAFASGKGTVMESTKELVEGAGQAVAGAVAQTGMLHAEEVPPINEQADTQQKMNGGEVDPSAAKPGPTVEERLNNEEPPHRDPSTPAYDNKTETRNKRASSVSRPIHLTIPNSHKNEGAVDGSDDELEDVPSSPAMNGDGTSPSRPSHVMLDQVKRQEAHRRPSFAETVLSQSTMSDEFSEGRARSSSVASNKDNFHFGSKKHRNSVSAARSSVQSSLPSKPPDITPEMFEDPLNPQFYESVWMKAAVINTEVFRKVRKLRYILNPLTWILTGLSMHS